MGHLVDVSLLLAEFANIKPPKNRQDKESLSVLFTSKLRKIYDGVTDPKDQDQLRRYISESGVFNKNFQFFHTKLFYSFDKRCRRCTCILHLNNHVKGERYCHYCVELLEKNPNKKVHLKL